MISIWLTPAAADRSELFAVISKLASTFNAPIFEPHVTIATSNTKAEATADALRGALQGVRAVPLGASKVGYSANFTNGLYISMDVSDQFRSLVRAINKCRGELQFPSAEPRLSLVYKANQERWKRQVSQSLDFSNRTYEFDAVKIVEMRDLIEHEQDVTEWTVRAAIQLLPREDQG